MLLFASLAFAMATGRLTPHHVDDTPSYLEYPFDSLSSALTSIRTPGYPALLRAMEGTLGLSAVPAMQWIVACLAGWWFAVELGRWKASKVARWVSAFAIVFGCTSLDHQSTLATDALAASIGVVTVTCVLRWVRRDRRHVDAGLVIVATMTAIMLRPAYLSIIVWIAVMGIVLLPPTRDVNRDTKPSLRSRILSTMRVSGCCVVLIFGWMTVRWVVVNDFGFLPFGHQNLAGLSLQMVSDDELKDIASQDPNPMVLKLVTQSLNRRIIASDARLTPPMSNYQQGPGLPTMTIENQWNDLIYQAVVPASIKLYPDDPIARHHAIGHLNRRIIQHYPGRYLRWLLLGARRAVWGIASDILMNPLFLCFWSVFGCYWLRDALTHQIWRADNPDHPHNRTTQSAVSKSPAVALLAVIALSYAFVMVGFVVLTSPPLGRFADAGAIFVPCWLMVWASEVALLRSADLEKVK